MKEDYKDLLTCFGLNQYEAQIYVFMLNNNALSARQISAVSDVAYSKTYEVLKSLCHKGFCVMKPEKPMQYYAVPIEEVHQAFIESRNRVLKKLTRDLNTISPGYRHGPDGCVFGIGRSHSMRKVQQLIEKAEGEIIILCTSKTIERIAFLHHVINNANKKGTQIFIDAVSTDTNAQDFKHFEGCHISHSNTWKSSVFMVDHSECLIVDPVPDDDSIMKGSDVSLYFRSPAVMMMQNCFKKIISNK